MISLEIIGIIEFDPPNETKKHEKQSEWKRNAHINIDGDIDRYYQWILYKRFGLEFKKQLRPPHMTFVSDRSSEMRNYNEIKSKYDGNKIKLSYFPKDIQTNGKHWWIDCHSEEAENIREELGLNRIPFHNFHISIGKVIDTVHMLEQSEYVMRQIKLFNL